MKIQLAGIMYAQSLTKLFSSNFIMKEFSREETGTAYALAVPNIRMALFFQVSLLLGDMYHKNRSAWGQFINLRVHTLPESSSLPELLSIDINLEWRPEYIYMTASLIADEFERLIREKGYV
jgi:hypothetical protein